MRWTLSSASQIHEISLVDLKGYKGFVRFAKLWDVWLYIAYALSIALCAGAALYLILATTDGSQGSMGMPENHLWAIVAGALVYGFVRARTQLMSWPAGIAITALAFTAALGYTFYDDVILLKQAFLADKTALKLQPRLMYAGLSGVVAAVACACVAILDLAALLTAFITLVINFVPTLVAKCSLFLFFPAWRKKVSVTFGGGFVIYRANIKSYVMHPDMRRNGKAPDEGIPHLSFSELNNPDARAAKLVPMLNSKESIDQVQALYPGILGGLAGAAAVSYIVQDHGGTIFEPAHDFSPINQVNPSTGLPMMDNVVDVGGHVFGTGSPGGVDMPSHDHSI